MKKNAFCLSIGVDPRKSISMVHHVELVCGVPYRFTITFKQKIKIGKRIIKKGAVLNIYKLLKKK